VVGTASRTTIAGSLSCFTAGFRQSFKCIAAYILVIALDRAGTDRRADRHDQTVIGERRTAAKPHGLGRRIDHRREA
jgi:hypothetical protein